ncbi:MULTISPECIES: alpha/beta fold hydrolase [unclassified Psychrobacter]|uniref:lipase family alpha/beta hydrolase n=1 Tax=unclassified Psychrobacter TaxID=196806 RepID=UPI0025B2F050|nr:MULTISPECIES: alpha/beta fold hydrolase [unclassified Psychrobacter]MDN3454054.1 alpha/beta fold hydrolase [Psychrobacter sp. APC 3350]MDN3503420.1 alpha/beta fold hydrolase [Psychrobacter sp. 5A.1]
MQQKNRVILIHGLHQTAWIMRPLAKRLQAAGFDTHQYGYRSMRDGIQTNSARLNSWLEINHHPDQPIDLVGHSLGGLIIRDFIAHYPQWKIGRCVTLGTPHNGSISGDYIWRLAPAIVGKSYEQALDGTVAPLPTHITLGVIAGNKAQGLGQPILAYHNRKLRKADKPLSKEQLAHDGTVYVEETKLTTATDHIIMPVSHTGMLVNKEVAKQAIYFLKHGKFEL